MQMPVVQHIDTRALCELVRTRIKDFLHWESLTMNSCSALTEIESISWKFEEDDKPNSNDC